MNNRTLLALMAASIYASQDDPEIDMAVSAEESVEIARLVLRKVDESLRKAPMGDPVKALPSPSASRRVSSHGHHFTGGR